MDGSDPIHFEEFCRGDRARTGKVSAVLNLLAFGGHVHGPNPSLLHPVGLIKIGLIKIGFIKIGLIRAGLLHQGLSASHGPQQEPNDLF